MRERKATFNIRVLAAPQPPPPPPPPFVGTTVTIRVGEGLAFKLRAVPLADGCESATVDWGDGSAVETFFEKIADAVHEYPAPGEYRIRISDDVRYIAIGSSTADSDYNLVYAPMVRKIVSNGQYLTQVAAYSYRNCHNLETADFSESNLHTLPAGCFMDCRSLTGELYFPKVDNVVGSSISMPFANCSRLTAIHFADLYKSKITAGNAYRTNSTLGTGVPDICRFDL